MTEIKCSYRSCKQPARFTLRVNKIPRPFCLEHFGKIKSKRISKEVSKGSVKTQTATNKAHISRRVIWDMFVLSITMKSLEEEKRLLMSILLIKQLWGKIKDE